MNKDDLDVLVVQENLKDKIEVCLYGKVNNDSMSEYYMKMMNHFYVNTKIRSESFSKVLGNAWVAGEEKVIPEGLGDRLAKCREI